MRPAAAGAGACAAGAWAPWATAPLLKCLIGREPGVVPWRSLIKLVIQVVRLLCPALRAGDSKGRTAV
jgi:hypothetical protein